MKFTIDLQTITTDDVRSSSTDRLWSTDDLNRFEAEVVFANVFSRTLESARGESMGIKEALSAAWADAGK